MEKKLLNPNMFTNINIIIEVSEIFKPSMYPFEPLFLPINIPPIKNEIIIAINLIILIKVYPKSSK